MFWCLKIEPWQIALVQAMHNWFVENVSVIVDAQNAFKPH